MESQGNPQGSGQWSWELTNRCLYEIAGRARAPPSHGFLLLCSGHRIFGSYGHFRLSSSVLAVVAPYCHGWRSDDRCNRYSVTSEWNEIKTVFICRYFLLALFHCNVWFFSFRKKPLKDFQKLRSNLFVPHHLRLLVTFLFGNFNIFNIWLVLSSFDLKPPHSKPKISQLTGDPINSIKSGSLQWQCFPSETENFHSANFHVSQHFL